MAGDSDLHDDVLTEAVRLLKLAIERPWQMGPDWRADVMQLIRRIEDGSGRDDSQADDSQDRGA